MRVLQRSSVCRAWLAIGTQALLVAAPLRAADEVPARRPNVVMIVVDDLNDWVGCLGGHPQVRTPHLDRLARRGVLFANAHCQAPICTPSRNSVLSGRFPSTTGCYDLDPLYDASASLADVVALPDHFAAAGYDTLGGGKVFHGSAGRHFGTTLDAGPADPQPPQRMNWRTAVWDWGPFPETDVQTRDHRLANAAADVLRHRRERPFFLAVGFARPHVPLHVPPKWFAPYDLDKVVLPHAPPDDLDDLPRAALEQPGNIAPRHAEMLEGNRWKSIVQAYLASIGFVDDCVGRVLEGLDSGPHAADTLVVLWSDHGFHLGEKQHWAKRTLWEESTRVPLIVTGPGIARGATCTRPVGLIDLYPTLIALCGLPPRAGLEGRSLAPLLSDPHAPWDRPALTTFLRGNHAVRSEHWRYIRYADGSQELYDHRTDPDEFRNLAGEAKYVDVIREHAAWLPKTDAEPARRTRPAPGSKPKPDRR